MQPMVWTVKLLFLYSSVQCHVQSANMRAAYVWHKHTTPVATNNGTGFSTYLPASTWDFQWLALLKNSSSNFSFSHTVSGDSKVRAMADKAPTAARKDHPRCLFVVWGPICGWDSKDFPDYEGACISFCKPPVQNVNPMLFWACIWQKLFIKNVIKCN